MQYHHHGQSILYPNEWARYDPAQNAYSPLAQFSSYTLKEHNETLDKLAAQLEIIARRLADNDVQGSEDHRRYTRMLDALQREESEIVVLLSHNRLRIEELQQSTSNEVVRRREEVELNHQTMRDCDSELQSILQLEADLSVMKRSIEEKLSATSQRKSLFTREFRHGMAILESDHQDARTASACTDGLIQNPRVMRPAAVLVESPTRRARSPMRNPTIVTEYARPRSPAVRPLSPNRPAQHVPTATTTSRLVRGSPRRTAAAAVFGTAEPPLSPRQAANASVFTPRAPVPAPALSYEEVAPEDFRPLSEAAERLHAACRQGRHDEIRTLLRTNQSAAFEKHPATGDTALHVLCGSPYYTTESVMDVCLANNDAANAFNKQGYYPFHVACLNPYDSADRLKMFMITNLSCDANQRTKTGETVAHLCARSDHLTGALRCVIERMKVDPTIRVQIANRQGYTQQMNVLDVAMESGEPAANNIQYLSWYFREHGLS